eukprot:4905234-Amphidinium_carterae.1
MWPWQLLNQPPCDSESAMLALCGIPRNRLPTEHVWVKKWELLSVEILALVPSPFTQFNLWAILHCHDWVPG